MFVCHTIVSLLEENHSLKIRNVKGCIKILSKHDTFQSEEGEDQMFCYIIVGLLTMFKYQLGVVCVLSVEFSIKKKEKKVFKHFVLPTHFKESLFLTIFFIKGRLQKKNMTNLGFWPKLVGGRGQRGFERPNLLYGLFCKC